jgi:hypothetical protein
MKRDEKVVGIIFPFPIQPQIGVDPPGVYLQQKTV